MAEVRSPYWDATDGICTKHLVPQLPCPICAQEKDPDVEVHFTLIDLDIAADEQIPLADLLPEDFAWVTNFV